LSIEPEYSSPLPGRTRDPYAAPLERPWSAPRRPDRVWLHVALLVATAATTTLAGALHYLAFIVDFGAREPQIGWAALLVKGTSYSATILGILGAHEMGHYLACRYYAVEASLPYFIPAPLLTGTLGAVIRIRQAFPSKAVLFDIAVAGPIAGFVVLVPALFIGLSLSTVARLPEDFSGYSLGEPLLFQLAAWLVWGPIPDGYSLNIHPIVFAAWFGLFATAVNLLPFGQLDGGHISYAALGRRATAISICTVIIAIALTVYSQSWLLVTALMLVMVFVMGARHPRVIDEAEPLDPARRWIAIAAVVIFVLCFTPNLIEVYELIPSA
jgi:membrane-associated protease RseP (regulator of RpoE activity)